jgi:protein farnesyltransferase/geranylgeranyltransferase type-1 subunit alpha
LHKSVDQELEFLTAQGTMHPKNYQVWHYRKELISSSEYLESELAFVESILAIDERNVHAWGHRMWITEKFEAYGREFEFVERYIGENERNNSAWNYRHFLVTKNGKRDEIGFVLRFVENIMNESCYSYLQSVFEEERAEEIKGKLKTVIDEHGIAPALLMFLLFLYEKERKPKISKVVCRKLKEVDQIHEQYWHYREESATGEVSEFSTNDKEICTLLGTSL